MLVFPADLTPVKGVAQIGTHEAAWFLALRAIGLDAARASTLAFATHAVLFAIMVVGLGVGLLLHATRPRAR